MSKVLSERIATLEAKLKQEKAKLAQIEAKKRTSDAKKRRAEDTRRKLLIGAFYLNKAEQNDTTKSKLFAALDGYLTRPEDRALFDLQPLESSQPKADPLSTPIPTELLASDD